MCSDVLFILLPWICGGGAVFFVDAFIVDNDIFYHRLHADVFNWFFRKCQKKSGSSGGGVRRLYLACDDVKFAGIA